MTFRILWAINLVLAAIIGYFFVAGLVDGSVSSFNSGIWFVILFAVGVVLLSAYMLRVTGYARLAYFPLWCAKVRSEAGAVRSFDAPTNLAGMFEIILAPEAVEDLRRLTANVRATVRAALETHLRHEPKKTSRSRIKRLRGLLRPQCRLR